MTTLHPLREVAEQWRLHEQMKNPTRLLIREIKAGRIRARKIGRSWLMTDEDIAHALEVFANVPATSSAQPEPAPAAAVALTPASMRRRLAVAQ